ncbi:Glutamate--tRNA ligase [Candidatus Bilamarchaeum dharawalense]|uniref:Glutamate--tRNA ligase n=1 Tax=Candidatus Bilamarchaeum dharawalense TaxID=2885759 RepID=A0A5E4LK75_9ARCH|nr:Glutamate--tRNA ligase [Candidatus Bilamarchaeum dharawalense]
MSLNSVIRKYVLKNAFDYGTANAGAVVGKVIAEYPDCKNDMKKTMQVIKDEITRTSKMSKSEIENEMNHFEYVEKKEEKKGIEVEGAEDGKVVVRYPPEPNGWPHIGHAKAFCLSWSIARKYNGKVILRWDDTNPEAEKPEFIDAIKNGVRWVGLDWDEEKYCSDYLPQMYELCEKLLKQCDAYFCTCTQEKISKGREDKVRCECGLNHQNENLKGWQQMLDGSIPEGGGIIRMRGDMWSDNTVMRDPTLFRIITTPHYRQGKKYRVWPTYDFQGAVMDSILDITHPIRSKEYELRDELYVYLLKKLGLHVPQMISISRLAIKNAPISKRLLRPLVEGGKLWGWDDPRLPSLAGLKRRGILPAAIREFVLSFGISKVESEPGWESLLAENRKLLDPDSPHYFFVPNPVKLIIENLEEKQIELKLHPKKNLGSRPIQVTKTVYVPESDVKQIKEGEVFRLKDLCNVKLTKKGEVLTGQVMHDEMVEKKIQWVSEDYLTCEVYTPKDLLNAKGEFDEKSLEVVKGYCEANCAGLMPDTMIQFERFGFCRLDEMPSMVQCAKPGPLRNSQATPLKFIFTC